MSFSIDSKQWARQQFGDCDLGDRRRTKRLIQMAEHVANHPAASFPGQMPDWADLKAAYRLFAADDVTFQAIATPHWRQTRQAPPGRYLVVNDTTEIDFGYHREIPGLSRIGNGSRSGFLLHNALLVDARTQALVGVAGQTIHYRRPAPKNETKAQRFKRPRESQMWGTVVDQVGPPPTGVEWVHVCDRDADDFEVFCHFLQNRSQWVVRASSRTRWILAPSGEKVRLDDHLKTLPLVGSYELHLRARPGVRARVAKLEVRMGALQMPKPRHHSDYVRALNPAPIPMGMVWVREVNPPKGCKAIDWALYTSLPLNSFEDAWQIVEYYECRWVVEEYHKALKTGCSVQSRLLQNADRLEAMVGLMSVVALRLLQLKSVARHEPDRPARTIIPPLWLEMLKAARKNLRRVCDLTIHEFYRELAKLGGFLGRRHDGDPGWITIWRGWERLNTLVRGAELARKNEKCG